MIAPADAVSARALANQDRITYPSHNGPPGRSLFGRSKTTSRLKAQAVSCSVTTVPVPLSPFGQVLPSDHQSKADKACKSDCQPDSLQFFGHFPAGYGFGDTHDNRAAVQH